MIFAAPNVILPPEKAAIVRASDLKGLPSWAEMQRRERALKEGMFPFPIMAPAHTQAWQSLVAPSLNTNVYAGFATYTIVQRIAVAAYSAISGSPSQVRVTFAADTGRNFILDSVWIGNAAATGDAYDAASLTELKFSGSSGFSITSGATILSDGLSLALDLTKDIIISQDWTNSGTTGARGIISLTNYTCYRKASVDEGSLADKTGYTAAGGTGVSDATVCGVSKVEILA